MLGVRRVGSLERSIGLARKGVIRLSRGRIWIVDREGLIFLPTAAMASPKR